MDESTIEVWNTNFRTVRKTPRKQAITLIPGIALITGITLITGTALIPTVKTLAKNIEEDGNN
jgi:hypothetical protein